MKHNHYQMKQRNVSKRFCLKIKDWFIILFLDKVIIQRI